MNITAVIVTFNHQKLLEECLSCLKKQTYQLNNIIVIDNASTDTTEEFMEKYIDDSQVTYKKLKSNTGGAGGFNKGISEAVKKNDDFIWLMDDDTMPQSDALGQLIRAAEDLNNDFGFLASNVRWIDGNPCLMNVPKPVTVWNKAINGNNFVEVSQATFVSLFIPMKVIQDVGLPIKDFFIWNDDTEFTIRITSKYKSYFIPDSYVVHKMAENHGVNIVEEENRIPRYFYSYRNRYYVAKKYGDKRLAKYYAHLGLDIVHVVAKSKYKLKKIKVIFKGYFSGLFFNPSIEYISKNYTNK